MYFYLIKLSWNAHYWNIVRNFKKNHNLPSTKVRWSFFPQIFLHQIICNVTNKIIWKVLEECVIFSVNSTKFPYF
jgi:hypothetical protein